MSKSHGLIPTTAAQAVERIMTATAMRGIHYGLGTGGRDPKAPSPGTVGKDGKARCDCSGLIAWAWRYDRLRLDGQWMSTDGMLRDAKGDQIYWIEVPPTEAMPGDVVVYGRLLVVPGHVAMIVGPWQGWERTAVVDCSGGWSHRFKGGAVKVRTARGWAKRGKVLRYVGAGRVG